MGALRRDRDGGERCRALHRRQVNHSAWEQSAWAQVERFCRIDGWREVRRGGHVFYEMVLADGTVLRTHRSLSSRKTMSPGRFKAILH